MAAAYEYDSLKPGNSLIRWVTVSVSSSCPFTHISGFYKSRPGRRIRCALCCIHLVLWQQVLYTVRAPNKVYRLTGSLLYVTVHFHDEGSSFMRAIKKNMHIIESVSYCFYISECRCKTCQVLEKRAEHCSELTYDTERVSVFSSFSYLFPSLFPSIFSRFFVCFFIPFICYFFFCPFFPFLVVFSFFIFYFLLIFIISFLFSFFILCLSFLIYYSFPCFSIHSVFPSPNFLPFLLVSLLPSLGHIYFLFICVIFPYLFRVFSSVILPWFLFLLSSFQKRCVVVTNDRKMILDIFFKDKCFEYFS